MGGVSMWRVSKEIASGPAPGWGGVGWVGLRACTCQTAPGRAQRCGEGRRIHAEAATQGVVHMARGEVGRMGCNVSGMRWPKGVEMWWPHGLCVLYVTIMVHSGQQSPNPAAGLHPLSRTCRTSHAIPSHTSTGGADHPDNYFKTDSRFNRRSSNGIGHAFCLFDGPNACPP